MLESRNFVVPRFPERPFPGDRRVWVRYPCNDQPRGQLFNTEDSRSQHGTIQNLSSGGIGLVLAEPIPLGTLLKVEMEACTGARMIRCQVKYIFEQPDGWLHGCELALPISGTGIDEMLS